MTKILEHLCRTNSIFQTRSSLLKTNREEEEEKLYQPAFPCSKLKDAISWALPVPPGWIQKTLQESLGTDVVEEKRTLAGAHCHNVLVETH